MRSAGDLVTRLFNLALLRRTEANVFFGRPNKDWETINHQSPMAWVYYLVTIARSFLAAKYSMRNMDSDTI